MIKEACVESFEEAIRVEKQGADRIELCAQLQIGGTTPSYGLIESVINRIKIPVMVMIRPRGGNFTYDSHEINKMQEDIEFCKSLKVHGVVLGLLDKNDHVDLKKTQEIIDLAKPLDITFHKAIDASYNIIKSIDDLKKLEGLSRVLSSGGYPTALEGINTLNNMIIHAGDHFKIMAAGKISSENLPYLAQNINTDEFHGRKIIGRLYRE